jgi:hypothetical protein
MFLRPAGGGCGGQVQPALDQVLADQWVPDHMRPVQVPADHIRPDHIRPDQVRLDHMRPDHIRPDQVVAVQLLPLKPLPVQTWPL